MPRVPSWQAGVHEDNVIDIDRRGLGRAGADRALFDQRIQRGVDGVEIAEQVVEQVEDMRAEVEKGRRRR